LHFRRREALTIAEADRSCGRNLRRRFRPLSTASISAYNGPFISGPFSQSWKISRFRANRPADAGV
jgi:hypothetical protein